MVTHVLFSSFQIDITTLGLIPVIDNKPPLNARNLPSQASSASFYLSEGESIEGIPYFHLPRSVLGNQIKSYGGYISYTLSLSGPVQISAPDFIIACEGYTLYHTLRNRLRPNFQNEVRVRFWSNEWRKTSPQGPYATREELLMCLSNVQQILIRAQYTPYPVEVTITQLQLASASPRNDGLGRAFYVEQCICPQGYAGLSCEVFTIDSLLKNML